ncbi:hypothetical protein CEXT_134011 [Caerostris extrusa]|uniref:Uncharacterized protein n=1 Tax=Caerostris extrusa TaxID=172846 RepID=A0AAV4MZP4_CAEEX|nr:hypothetical protein CEXT_134011 [Caerostris extrusa]
MQRHWISSSSSSADIKSHFYLCHSCIPRRLACVVATGFLQKLIKSIVCFTSFGFQGGRERRLATGVYLPPSPLSFADWDRIF